MGVTPAQVLIRWGWQGTLGGKEASCWRADPAALLPLLPTHQACLPPRCYPLPPSPLVPPLVSWPACSWSMQKGFVPLPKSNHPERQQTNLDVFRWVGGGVGACGQGGWWGGWLAGRGAARVLGKSTHTTSFHLTQSSATRCALPCFIPYPTHATSCTPPLHLVPCCACTPRPSRFELCSDDVAALDRLEEGLVTGWDPIAMHDV